MDDVIFSHHQPDTFVLFFFKKHLQRCQVVVLKLSERLKSDLKIVSFSSVYCASVFCKVRHAPHVHFTFFSTQICLIFNSHRDQCMNFHTEQRGWASVCLEIYSNACTQTDNTPPFTCFAPNRPIDSQSETRASH